MTQKSNPNPVQHPNQFPHSGVFGSNINFQLEQFLEAQSQEMTQDGHHPVPPQERQPHIYNPLPHQDKYNRRIDMPR
ncbi:MAG: hypothetical protein AABZ60_09995 [Planctomycetota bacterium]